jgi:hypothetical protein
MLEMPIPFIKRHFLLAYQAFKNHTGHRELIPYLTEPEYRFVFEGISPTRKFSSVKPGNSQLPRRENNR